MASEGEKTGLAAAVGICLDEQADLRDQAEREAMSDLFGEVVPPREPGRPAGAVNKATALEVAAIKASGQSPLAFLASIWRDPMKPLDKRITAATVAMPYLHRKQPVDLTVNSEPFTLILGDEGLLDGDDVTADDVADFDVIEGDFEVDGDELSHSKTSTKTEG